MKLRLFGLLLITLCLSPAVARPQEKKVEMDHYQLGLLRRGPQWTAESTPETQKVQAQHMAHIGKMAESGKLVGAGPFLDGGQLRGVFIFKATAEEAKALSEADPAVQAGRLSLELHPWYAPKGIGEKYAAMVKDKSPADVEMVTYYFGLLTRGPGWTAETTPETQKIQEGHMANIRRLAAAGKLVSAGPFGDGGQLRGVFIFKAGSLEEAKALAETDPAVRAGRLAVELRPWMVAKGVIE